MTRATGRYQVTSTLGEEVRAFVPYPLPPADPPLMMDGPVVELNAAAQAAVTRLAVAGTMVPSTGWSLYGFVRKEAVISSQIEGTQATLRDVLTFEATARAERPDDVEEVCNYVGRGGAGSSWSACARLPTTVSEWRRRSTPSQVATADTSFPMLVPPSPPFACTTTCPPIRSSPFPTLASSLA